MPCRVWQIPGEKKSDLLFRGKFGEISSLFDINLLYTYLKLIVSAIRKC